MTIRDLTYLTVSIIRQILKRVNNKNKLVKQMVQVKCSTCNECGYFNHQKDYHDKYTAFLIQTDFFHVLGNLWAISHS